MVNNVIVVVNYVIAPRASLLNFTLAGSAATCVRSLPCCLVSCAARPSAGRHLPALQPSVLQNGGAAYFIGMMFPLGELHVAAG